MPLLPYIDFTPTPSGTQYNVNTFQLSPTDISNGYVNLTGTPTDVDKTVLGIIGGDSQEYGTDFIVLGTQLIWSSLGLDGVLVSGDKIYVQFN